MHGGGAGGQHGKNGWISEACASSSQQGVLTEWDVGGLFGWVSARGKGWKPSFRKEGRASNTGLGRSFLLLVSVQGPQCM